MISFPLRKTFQHAISFRDYLSHAANSQTTLTFCCKSNVIGSGPEITVEKCSRSEVSDILAVWIGFAFNQNSSKTTMVDETESCSLIRTEVTSQPKAWSACVLIISLHRILSPLSKITKYFRTNSPKDFLCDKCLEEMSRIKTFCETNILKKCLEKDF